MQPHLFVLGLVPNTFILGIAPHIGSLLFLARVHISAARAGAVDRHAGCKQALCGEHHDCEGRADIFFSHSFSNLIVGVLFHINLFAVSDVETLSCFRHAAAAEVVAGGGRNGSGRFNQSFYLRGGAIVEHHALDIAAGGKRQVSPAAFHGGASIPAEHLRVRFGGATGLLNGIDRADIGRRCHGFKTASQRIFHASVQGGL